MNSIEWSFLFFGILTIIILVTTEIVLRKIGVTKSEPDFHIQALSWVIGGLISIIGNIFNIGFFSGLHWYWALIYGFGASLAANGLADTKIIKKIFLLFNKK